MHANHTNAQFPGKRALVGCLLTLSFYLFLSFIYTISPSVPRASRVWLFPSSYNLDSVSTECIHYVQTLFMVLWAPSWLVSMRMRLS